MYIIFINIYIYIYKYIYIYIHINTLLHYYIIDIYIIDSKSFSRVMPCLYVWHLQLQTMAWAKRFPRHRQWRWYLQKMILLWKMNMLNFFPPIKTCLHLATYEHLYWCQVGKIFWNQLSTSASCHYRHQHHPLGHSTSLRLEVLKKPPAPQELEKCYILLSISTAT